MNKKTNIFVVILLINIFFSSCLEPCKHKKTYDNCSDYQITWGEGINVQFENIYTYMIVDNCITIVEGDICNRCGLVIGFTERKICGSYTIENHTFCR